jgi:hypothetical protein
MPDAELRTDSLRILVVGGASRKAGKTCVVEAILRAFPKCQWTAVKISSHLHDSPRGGELLADASPVREGAGQNAELGAGGFRLWERAEPRSFTDTGRFIAAGAARALLLEGNDEHLPDAVAALLELLRDTRAGTVICETTRAAPLLGARLFLMVAGGDSAAPKASARRNGHFADATIVFASAGDSTEIYDKAVPDDRSNAARRERNGGSLTPGPVFRMQGGNLPDDLRSFIERRFWGGCR